VKSFHQVYHKAPSKFARTLYLILLLAFLPAS
jgi:hypothetical protein